MSFNVYSIETLHQLPAGKSYYGVIGDPVAHSLSPFIHNPAFQDLSINAEYVRIHLKPDEFEKGIQELQKKGFQGWNCTVPHKETMVKLCDQLDPSAERFQSVNTVRIEEGKRIGFNTDGLGWVRAIREEFKIDCSELRIMILGVGGAGRALAIQSALENCERLVLANRTLDKAQTLKKEIDLLLRRGKAWQESLPVSVIPLEAKALEKELHQIDLVVNCTSAGLNPENPSLIPAEFLNSEILIYDTIYKPNPTALLKEAQKAGCRHAHGISMLLHQAVLAFEIWTGRVAPLDLMRQALLEKNS